MQTDHRPPRRGPRTHSVCIRDSPQKAPSVSRLMLFRCSFSTSKLSSPWNVRPSISRIRFRLRSLKRQSRWVQSSWHDPSPAAKPTATAEFPGKTRVGVPEELVCKAPTRQPRHCPALAEEQRRGALLS